MKKLYRILVVVLVLLLAVTVLVACDSHEHNYDQTGSDAEGHWNYCKEDNAIDETSRAEHVDANSDGKCDVCGYEIPHTHEYNVAKNDDSYHWKECSCGERDKSTIASHADDNKDGKCDGCGFAMPLPKNEYIGIKEIDGAPTLVVEGPMPEGVECIKLHYDANGQNYFVENSATDSISFIFNLPLNTLPIEKTPWCWFHIYTYSVATPSDTDEPVVTNLMREKLVGADQAIEYNNVNYKLITEPSSKGMVVIQPVAISQTELSFDLSGVPAVVLKGKASPDVKSVAIHVDGNDNDEWFGDAVAVSNGTFEVRFEINKIKLDGTPYGWFHLYGYKSENVESNESLKAYDLMIDISRGDKQIGKLVDYKDVRYLVIEKDQLVIQPNNLPAFDITDISVNNEAILTIKGDVNKTVGALVIHADGDGENWYGTVGHVTDGKFELTFKLDQLKKDTDCYVHVYSYEVEPDESNLATNKEKVDVKIGDFVSYGQLVEYNGVKYSAVTNDWSSLIIKAASAE